MPASVNVLLGNAASGGSFTDTQHRLGMASRATVMTDGSANPLLARSGIIPSDGAPLDVSALGTPAMFVQVQPGECMIQSTSVTGGVFSVINTALINNLTIAAANATNPRLDLVVARVNSLTGVAAIEVLTGTPAATPSRPSIASPPANTHYFPLAQVRVEANATTIIASKVTKVAGVDGVFTAAPGGTVRGVTRMWQGIKNPGQDNSAGGGAIGFICSATIPAAQALPGVYVCSWFATVKPLLASGYGNFDMRITTPDGTRVVPYEPPAQRRVPLIGTEPFTLNTKSGTDIVVTLQVQNFDTDAIGIGDATNFSVLKVVRVSDT